VTALYATTQSWPTVVPGWVTAGGVAATLLVGVIAGLYPAIRAARLAPTEALATPDGQPSKSFGRPVSIPVVYVRRTDEDK
jgi:flavin-dependent dehydrogenase